MPASNPAEEEIDLTPELLSGAVAVNEEIDLTPEMLQGAVPMGASGVAMPHAPGFARTAGPWQDPAEQEKVARIARENEAGYTAPPTFLQKLATAAGAGYHKPIVPDPTNLTTRIMAGVTGQTPEGYIKRSNDYKRDYPKEFAAQAGIDSVQADVGGVMAGAGAAGILERAPALLSAMPRALPYFADAAGGAVGSATTNLASGTPNTLEGTAQAAAGSAALGRVLRTGGAGADSLADKIKQSKTPAGEDITLLEQRGYTPSWVPGKPVENMTPRVDYGPNLPASPAEAQGLRANAAGRGEAGNLASRTFEEELRVREKLAEERLRRRNWRQDQPGGQGATSISTEPSIAKVDAELASPAVEIMPGARGQMSNLRTALTRDMEPTVDIHHAPVEGYVPKQGPHAPLVPSAEINSFENIRRYADPHDVEGLHQLHQEHLAQERAGTRTSSVGRFGHEPPPEPVTDDQILSGAPPPPLPGPAGAPVSEDQIMSREPTAEAPPSGPAPHEALAQHLGIRRRLPTPDPLVGPPSVPLPPTQETVTTPRGTTGFRESPGGPLGYRARVIDADPLTSSPVNMGGAPADFTGHARVRSHLGEPTHKDAFIPSGESTVTSTVDRPRTASAGGVEPERVGIGDVRGRVTTPAERGLEALGPGHPPQHVRTAGDLNRLRIGLDELGNVGATEGHTRAQMPAVHMASELRERVREHAPKIAAANLRRHIIRNETERAQTLMKDAADIPESFGMQLAGQGEEGSKAVGNRTPRLRDFREGGGGNTPSQPSQNPGGERGGMPTSSRLSRADIERLMDDPKLLYAQERMSGGKLARIGSGGPDTWMRSEPLVGRGLYPFLRGAHARAPSWARTAAGTYGALGPDDTLKLGEGFAVGGAGAALLPYYALRKLLGKGEGERGR